MKVVINKCYGGFGLSEKAEQRYVELTGRTTNGKKILGYLLDRTDPALVQVVEELGSESWGNLSQLKVVEIPDDIDWYIEEYDGSEWVAEVHRVWE